MNFNNPYSREAYKEFFQNQFLTDDFKISEEKLSFEFTPQYLKNAFVIGEDKSLEIKVLEVLHDSENDPRVGLSKDIFRLMSSYGYKRALVLLHSSKSKNYRLSLATIELSLEGSKVKKEYSNPRRYSFFLGPDAKVKTPHNFLISKGRVKDFEDLLSRFSVEVVTKQFYQEIANWYFWAMDEVEFPGDVEKDKEQRNAKNLIRLITRLIFIWFMKEKNLVPKTLFEKSFVDKVLNYKDKTGSTYYKAILQNLFFATLNTPMKKDDPNSRIFVDEAEKKGYLSDAHLEQGYYRYSRFIKDKELFLKQFENVPFLNGGLFESLDKDKDLRVDCFSDNPRNENRLKVPDELFFLDREIEVDISKHIESSKNKKVTGLFEILNRYNFTIDENTPIDQDVALDPELLGKVFENLLASYNPETSTPARKATGSYYTPREIVDYMVEESLIEYCKRIILDSFLGGEENLRNEDASVTLADRLRSLFDYSNDENPFMDEPEIILKLIDAIEQIKIIDPACGSGAFPMGILHKLVLALHKLDPENKLWKERLLKRVPAEIREETDKSLQNKSIDYIRKLGLIEHCIYGVDIQEIAIQISKLRFFISLLVEQQIDDSKPNRDIRALPNLETKFVAANTLIGLEKLPDELFVSDTQEIIKELFKVREDFFFANSRSKKKELERREEELKKALIESMKKSIEIINKKRIQEYKIEIERLNKELVNLSGQTDEIKIIETSNLFGEKEKETINKTEAKRQEIKRRKIVCEYELEKLERPRIEPIIEIAKKIVDFNPYDQNKSNSWFDPIWMFGVKGGFDIVIGNPPYIQLQKAFNNKIKYADLYKNQNYKTFDRTGDIYCLFYEKGIHLSKQNGLLTYITSNKWMRAGYGEKLREFFIKYNPLQLVDLGPGVFENATVDTNILLIRKRETSLSRSGDASATLAVTLQKEDKDDIAKALIEKGVLLTKLTNEAWFIGSDAEQQLKEKIERIGKPLKDWDVNIYRGILTGLNEAFIIDTEKRNQILANCKDEAERRRTEAIIKPILRGRDIKRYYYEWAGLWVIVIPAGWTNQNRRGEKPAIFIERNFPSLMQHLKQFEVKAKKRDDQGDYWWELRHCAYYPEFEKEKVVWQEMAQDPSFAFDEKSMYCNDTGRILVGNFVKYFLGIFNSKFFKFSFSKWYAGGGLGDRGIRFKSEFMKEYPIPLPISSNESIVKQIELLVDKILAANASTSSAQAPKPDNSQWEREIDELVYKLYNLTEEEIKIIEGGNEPH
ncbi:MAG: Eco57I restriction-modification methylase domain-containing protein [Ignavibacteriaceae bacterium]|nr:Eco57I restriction-modification methylase domain-containing protein [Ignavibacteriaceae bacterium]